MEKINVAIDGPAGAGKSTVARLVAERLGFLYIDTGAMYRALTLKALQLKLHLENESELTKLAQETSIRLIQGTEGQRVFLDQVEVTEDIRTPEVSHNVSFVAKVPGVRQEMVRLQRLMALEGGIVMDGRDIGTNVLPKAEKKFFLTASLAERANRRLLELEAKGFKVDLEELTRDIVRRDSIDEERETAPLVQALDAILIDTTGMDIGEVVDMIITYCEG